MPFTWKNKTRRSRFSQLVADHLQSPKRGGSLVVETGFPTSLIDLYVRNRGRFRKSSAKKHKGNNSPTRLSSCSSPPSSAALSNLNNLSLSGSLVDSNNSSSGYSDCKGIDEIIEEDVVGGGMPVSNGEIESKNYSKSEAERSVGIAERNLVLVVALKVLFMLILVSGSKRFTIAITLSAFLLFFLELLGKHMLGRSISIRPGGDSEPMFESTFQGIKNIKSSKLNATLVVCSEVLEIEEQVASRQEVRSEKEPDEVRSEVLMEIRHKSSRKAIMKSRIKKLVAKKLRESSMDSKHKMPCNVKEEGEEETLKSVKPSVLSNERSDSKGQSLCILKQNQDKIVDAGGQSSSSTLSSEIECNGEKVGRDLQQKSGCLVLLLIVLVGLIRGRGMALVIALGWCLMQKKLEARYVKFSVS